jgi:hypothetical protein
MRLQEIDRGDSIFNRLLIAFISLVSGMRLPDAARVAFYHKDFSVAQWVRGHRRRCVDQAHGALAIVN